MLKPEDVYKEIEDAKLSRLYLSSTYQCTEQWTKESLQFKVLLDFLVGGDVSVEDVQERLKILAAKDVDIQYANPEDVSIYVYLLALHELNAPYSERGQADFRKGCEIIKDVPNLHWARRFQTWASAQIQHDLDDPQD
jgi:hypothetical protein